MRVIAETNRNSLRILLQEKIKNDNLKSRKKKNICRDNIGREIDVKMFLNPIFIISYDLMFLSFQHLKITEENANSR